MGFLNFVEERRQADGNDALLFNELSFDPKHLYSRDPSRFFCGPCTVQDTSVSTVRRRLMAGSILKVSVARLPFGWNGQAYLHPRSPICSAMRVVHQSHSRPLPGAATESEITGADGTGLTYNAQTEQIRWEHF